MDDQPILLDALPMKARQRLCRIAADMGRTPSDLACAVLSQWSATVFLNLANRKKPSPDRPDFERLGIILQPKDHD